MNAGELLPNALEPTVRRKYDIFEALRVDMAGVYPESYVYDTLLREVGIDPDNLGPRDFEVVTMSVFLVHERLRPYGTHSRTLAKYLPSYMSFDYSSTQANPGNNTHILMGSLTPYSTWAHNIAIGHIFGNCANTLHFDIESTRLTTIDCPPSSFQADALDLPLVENSVTSMMSNNLLVYLEGWQIPYALEEVDRVLQSGGAYVGVEDLSLAYWMEEFFRERGYLTESGPALCYDSGLEEDMFFKSGIPNYKYVRTQDRELFALKATKP